jgi:hypothetical protein
VRATCEPSVRSRAARRTRPSDLELLLELDPGRSLLDLGGLQFELEVLLGCRVDVVTEKGLKRRIHDRVLREAVPV